MPASGARLRRTALVCPSSGAGAKLGFRPSNSCALIPPSAGHPAALQTDPTPAKHPGLSADGILGDPKMKGWFVMIFFAYFC